MSERPQTQTLEAKCYKGEDSCKQVWAAGPTPRSPISFDAYEEFYIPGTMPAEVLGKFALKVTSRVLEGELTYSLSLYVSRAVSGWNARPSNYVFRLASKDSMVARLLSLEQVHPTLSFLKNVAGGQGFVPPSLDTPKARPAQLSVRVPSIDVVGPSDSVFASLPVSILVSQ